MKARWLAALAALLPGCATIIDGTHVDIPIRSDPEGAYFELRTPEGAVVAKGETPKTVNVPRSRGPWSAARYELTVSKAGYLPKRSQLKTRISPLGFIDWLIFVPSLVDYTVGSAWQVDEPPVQVLYLEVPFQRPSP